MPADISSAVAIVSPPGYALKAFDVPIEGRTVVLHAAEGGGTLRVRLPADGGRPVIRQDGKSLPLADLTRWALSQGVRLSLDGTLLEVPNVAAGAYNALHFSRGQDACLQGGTAQSGGEPRAGFVALTPRA